ncbi:hypothetical protein GCM10011391_08680 [Pullulanibacillus camelliae]|uniref:YkoP-like domain-containing protein n=2 Tax=Pullulanibacillus camelliae TaxID=1707096 RepID=A0A8J2VJL9_9BACL|nr:hypothetical protein GCM10011391_08680 [Pullulanibacillus camelliae]
MEQRNQEMPSIPLKKRLLMKMYSIWEHIYHITHRVQLEDEQDLLMFRTITYKGSPLTLSDGTVIRKGDRVLELHFNNELLLHTALQTKNTVHMITTLLHMMKATFNRMQTYIAMPKYQEAKALYGISLFHRGAKQFGFDVLDLPQGGNTAFQRFYLRMLLAIMHPGGRNRLKSHASMLAPKVLAVSIERFKQKDEDQV